MPYDFTKKRDGISVSFFLCAGGSPKGDRRIALAIVVRGNVPFIDVQVAHPKGIDVLH